MSTTVRRYDASTPLAAPVRLPNGYLRVEGYLARVGVQEYRMPDGTIRREFRPPEEVFHPDTLESARAAPVTDEHPPVPLTSENTRQYQRGHVDGSVVRDGDLTRGTLLITDADLIRKVESGEQRENSFGYSCRIDETPGVWTDAQGVAHPYDGVQRGILINHNAVTRRARGGPALRVRMDAGDAAASDLGEVTYVPSDVTDPNPSNEGKHRMSTVKTAIGGQTFDLPEDASKAVTAALASAQQQVKEATTKADSATARADSADAALATAEKQRTDSEANIPAMVSERAALIVRAKPVLGAALKMDSAPENIRRQCVEKLAPSLKLDSKSADYVAALFDVEMERFEKAQPAPRADGAPPPAGTKTPEQLRADSEAASRNAHKRTLGQN